MTLPANRQEFFSTLENIINTDANASLALMLIDVRNFKRINALYGFELGDQLISDAFTKIKQQLRKKDYAFQIGVDTFAVILPGLAHADLSRLAANKILSAMEYPFKKSDLSIRLFFSIGIVLLDEPHQTSESLFIDAEKALRQAKEQQIPLVVLDKVDQKNQQYLWNIEENLQQALAAHELELFYQPIIDLNTGQPSHAEALMRWNSPTLGYVPPDIFIPAAERIGLIDNLTHWSINTALRQSTEWQPYVTTLPVAVNLSGVIIHDITLNDSIQSALKIWGVLPARLILEVTETALIKNPTQSLSNLLHLRDLGINISIDDFGTGYSSLQYFKMLPVSQIKVDRSFIQNIDSDKADANIVKFIIELAHTFNMSVVAEGVETKNIMTILDALGCDQLQGYHFAKPMPQATFKQWLNEYNPRKFFEDMASNEEKK